AGMNIRNKMPCLALATTAASAAKSTLPGAAEPDANRGPVGRWLGHRVRGAVGADQVGKGAGGGAQTVPLVAVDLAWLGVVDQQPVVLSGAQPRCGPVGAAGPRRLWCVQVICCAPTGAAR